MALLHSEKQPLGSVMPEFKLKGVDGKWYEPEQFRDKKVLIILFICSHCPYVQAIEGRMIRLERDFSGKSVQMIGICANDPTDYPDDAPANLKKRWLEKDYRFPYLIDESQETAKAFGAVCTPDIFVYDENRKLAYHGQLDNNWKEPEKVTRRDLKDAVDQLLSGQKPTGDQFPSMGCSIKWKKSC